MNVFLKTYSGLKRHLSYRGWVSKTASTAANGVAQGCSVPLLAINVPLIPHVSCRVFIDDVRIFGCVFSTSNRSSLFRLPFCGPTWWGKNSIRVRVLCGLPRPPAIRRQKKKFPDFPLALEFDALGAIIYTSQRNARACTQDKVYKISAVIKNIGAVPAKRKTKAKLIAAKVIPVFFCCWHL